MGPPSPSASTLTLTLALTLALTRAHLLHLLPRLLHLLVERVALVPPLLQLAARDLVRVRARVRVKGRVRVRGRGRGRFTG